MQAPLCTASPMQPPHAPALVLNRKPPVGATHSCIAAQAAASAVRYAAGAPLSVLDGVPFAVKDAVDAFPLRTGHGTSFLGDM
jgi:Asp-tRNA(Asn)/Glu-tRNA(Gln) amidotransferase A subunit family amidase